MKHYLWLVGPLVMLWGAEARASNIEVETYHDSSKTNRAYTSNRQDDFTEHVFRGPRFDIGYTSDTIRHGYFPGATGQSQVAEEHRTHEGSKFKDFEYKDRDRYGDDDEKYNDDKYKVKGDHQYSKRDRDYDREYDRTHEGSKFKDFEYKDRDRYGDNDDKYKVKGDYQYSKRDRDYGWDDKKDYDRPKYPPKDPKDPHPYPKVPEPTSLLLLGAGLAGIGIWKRWKG